MDISELQHRVDLIDASFKVAKTADTVEFKYHKAVSGVEVWHYQYADDSKEGQLDFKNKLCSLLNNIVSVKDHLKKFLKHNGHDPQWVEKAMNENKDLQIVIDLANREKHGKSRESKSGQFPKVGSVRRALVLGGGATVNITAPVLNDNDEVIGDCLDIAEKAIRAWESLLKELGLMKPDEKKQFL